MDLETHKKFCKSILGKSYPEVDQVLDLMWWVNPKDHREWGHNSLIPLYLWLIGEEEIARAVAAHLLLDQVTSTKKNKRLISLLLK